MTLTSHQRHDNCCSETTQAQNLIKTNLLYSEKYISLNHFESKETKTFSTPIILVPSLFKESKIFDIKYQNNLILDLIEKGFDVYSVDFGILDKSTSHLRLGDYILNFLYRAIHMVRKHSKSKHVNFIGYGFGGLLGILYSSVPIDIKDDIKNLIYICDTSEIKLLTMFDKVFKPLEKEWASAGEKYGYIPSFYLNLLSFAIDFSTGFKNIPETIYKELYKAITENELVEGKLSLLDQFANLSNYKQPTLIISNIKPQAFDLFRDKTSSSDITYNNNINLKNTIYNWLCERNEKLA